MGGSAVLLVSGLDLILHKCIELDLIPSRQNSGYSPQGISSYLVPFCLSVIFTPEKRTAGFPENSKYTKGRGETSGYPSLQLLGGVQNVSFLGCGSLHSLEIRLRLPESSTRWVPGEEAGQWQSAADLLDACCCA